MKNKRPWLKVILQISAIGLCLGALAIFIVKKEGDIVEEIKEISPLSHQKRENITAVVKSVDIAAEIRAREESQVQLLEKREERINFLISQLENKDWTKVQEAMEKLAKMRALAVPSLIEKLRVGSTAAKGQIAFLLGRIQNRDAVSALMDTTNHENAYVRRNVMEALGKINDPIAIPALIKGLYDTDAQVRARAAWALGELSANLAVDDLLKTLNLEREEGTKIIIVEALAKIRDARATLTLTKELLARNDQSYKNQIVAALGEIADMRALPTLTNYLDDLKKYQPTDPMFIFELNEAIKITETAIESIKNKKAA